IVLGAGGMGSATLCQLARRGVKGCGIEQFGPGHDRGSSHGESRIIRKAYFEHPDYVPLLNRSFDLWDVISQETRQELQVWNGLIVAGKPGSATIKGLESCYRKYELPHERWTTSETCKHFPQFEFSLDYDVFYDPFGGYLKVEQCVQANIELARKHGADIFFNEKILSWQANDSSVLVKTDRRELHAGALIITPGAWATSLLASIAIEVEIWRKVLVWYQSPDLDIFTPDIFPTYYVEMDYGGFYGFPVISEKGFKAAEHLHANIISEPDKVERALLLEDEKPLLSFLADVFPSITEPTRTAHQVCMYTKSPDDHFILGCHPEHKNVVIGAGFSGHGFKFAPVIGEILADLALNGETEHPIEFLKLDRFI
ncbi:MAG: N-methyl-L-tryptophan oxidase, partial [bacterium]